MDLYVSKLERLDSERAHRAIETIIESGKFMPAISEIFDAYRQQKKTITESNGYDGPPLTEEQRLENVRRIRELMAHASENWDMESIPKRYQGDWPGRFRKPKNV